MKLAQAIVALKAELARSYNGAAHFYEVMPLEPSNILPIDASILSLLRRFAECNPIYSRFCDLSVLGIPCRIYEGDINEYWLGSIKHDTSYQAFYPTWILSAYALVDKAKSLGFGQVVDIGSGDGRISYCAQAAGMRACGIEIDEGLVELQGRISQKTGVAHDTRRADATRFDYSSLGLKNPAFFISAMPEMGEMLANSVISRVLSMPGMQGAGFVFMGSHTPKKYSRDHLQWGWGSVIKSHRLEVLATVTLPTQWTADQEMDTPYVFTRRDF
ncbi:MAG: hypothetical protein ACREAY_03775 [Nitrososphaera sp.]|uniref:hypothetical protein n=1 Tax=Nitrososphaera sp. TaxID=1971748 RepID=UPI003D6F72F8